MLALAACGSNEAKPDALIIIPDAPIDAKVWMDAPPVSYDLSCLGMSPDTTADDPISVAGTTQSFGMGGGMALENVAVDVFKEGDPNSLGSDTSDSAGAFSITDIATGGTPVDGYVRAGLATYRSTYMYPPGAVVESLTGVPVIMISNALFSQISLIAGAQDDMDNGALLFAVTDCTALSGSSIADLELIAEATVSVTQNGASVGSVLPLGLASAQLAGVFIATNVPDGLTQISASYNGMNFPVRTVRAFKKPEGQNAEGTITFTVVRPGP